MQLLIPFELFEEKSMFFAYEIHS
uniref:Uncharacterized protein n=1 Tax=Arundo donax TaxID=35708 RepID=A0A0A9A9A9_ARUDO